MVSGVKAPGVYSASDWMTLHSVYTTMLCSGRELAMNQSAFGRYNSTSFYLELFYLLFVSKMVNRKRCSPKEEKKLLPWFNCRFDLVCNYLGFETKLIGVTKKSVETNRSKAWYYYK